MIQITPKMRILVAIEAVDLRKGIDGLAQLCREKLGADPFSGCLFIFRSRRATAIKVLAYDRLPDDTLGNRGVEVSGRCWWEGLLSPGIRKACRLLKAIPTL